ncbi:unnamed protein product [Psylliodes chrysocephalus]|uniref:Migration and invasion enhancer 1 n=1 Tax=Psylliodes chrysocephalus TaxID=3402493 RepID=A0A9P0D765_9CUCU|nr:unnamed protein product [Psylliodes chrysocephala]
MEQNSDPEVSVEYCNKCGYLNKFQELVEHLEEKHPSLKVIGREGRRGSFEVAVNGTVVHSKLSTLAYPDYEDLSKIILETKEGKSVRKCKEQPITSCSLS